MGPMNVKFYMFRAFKCKEVHRRFTFGSCGQDGGTFYRPLYVLSLGGGRENPRQIAAGKYRDACRRVCNIAHRQQNPSNGSSIRKDYDREPL